MSKFFALALLTLSAAAQAQAQAQARYRPFDFVAGVGVTAGGSTLTTVQYADGSSQDISAGSGVMLYAGGETRIGEIGSFQATFGYHVDTTHGRNGDVSFSRYPIELLAYVPLNPSLRVGIGARFVNNPRLQGSGVASSVDVKFDSTVGFVFEGEYRFTPLIGVKLRSVSERFTATGTNQSVNGDHFGLLCNFYF